MAWSDNIDPRLVRKLMPGYEDTPKITPAMFEEQQQKKKGLFSTIASPILTLGGTVANMAGQPYIGVPLMVAGGAAGGADEGMPGVAKGAGLAGARTALTYGASQGLGGIGDILQGSKTAGPMTSMWDTAVPKLDEYGMPITIPKGSTVGGSSLFGGS